MRRLKERFSRFAGSRTRALGTGDWRRDVQPGEVLGPAAVLAGLSRRRQGTSEQLRALVENTTGGLRIGRDVMDLDPEGKAVVQVAVQGIVIHDVRRPADRMTVDG